MEILISAIIWVGKILIAVIALIGGALAVWLAWAALAWATTKHEPVEYYLGWDGYSHPIRLYRKISKAEADALHANGSVYLIGHYDGRKLTRVTKILKGAVFFDFEYTYHAHGVLKSAKTTNAQGEVKIREYDRWGRGRRDGPGFW
jgi:hypothetical protein